MTIHDKIRDEKLLYDINRKAAEISALSSEKTDKNEYLIGGEILPPDQRRVIKLKLHILSQVKLLKNKQKQLKNKEKNYRSTNCYYKSKQKIRGFKQ